MRATRPDMTRSVSEPDIMFLTRKWPPATGGMETYSVRLTEALAKDRPVDVVALPGRADGMPPTAAQLLVFPLTVLKRAFARRSSPRVLHLGDMAVWPLAALTLFWRGTRVVLSAHGTDVAYHRRGGIRGTLYGAYLKVGARLLRKAQVIANSRATARVAAETGWHDATVVPLATERLHAAAADGANDGTILFVGRLVERKGCAWFVRQVLPLLPQGTRLLVAGTVWDEQERAALSAPGVEFVGPVHGPSLTKLYRRAKCVILPNIETSTGEYEGFGLVAPEAAAAGALVLASRCDGLVDAVIDGTTGLLIEPGNPAAWAECIHNISGWQPERRRSFLIGAQAAATEHYCWSRVARDTRLAYALDQPLHKSGAHLFAQ